MDQRIGQAVFSYTYVYLFVEYLIALSKSQLKQYGIEWHDGESSINWKGNERKG